MAKLPRRYVTRAMTMLTNQILVVGVDDEEVDDAEEDMVTMRRPSGVAGPFDTNKESEHTGFGVASVASHVKKVRLAEPSLARLGAEGGRRGSPRSRRSGSQGHDSKHKLHRAWSGWSCHWWG